MVDRRCGTGIMDDIRPVGVVHFVSARSMIKHTDNDFSGGWLLERS